MGYAINHVTIINGTKNMLPQNDMSIIVNDQGKIAAIAPSDKVSISKNMKCYDFSGKYILPGLINLHCHLCGSGKPTSSSGAAKLAGLVTGNPLGRAYLRRTIKKNAQTQLLSGVTTLRSSGDPSYADVAVRDSFNETTLGPRMLCPGWGITPPSGHGRGIIALMAHTPEEARQLVDDAAKHKVDCIKLLITGGVFDAEKPGEPGLLRMNPEMISAACEQAHKYNLPVAAHVESSEGIKAALEGGVDTIEHGAPLDDELITLFKKNGAGNTSSLTTTISPAIPLARMSPEKTHSTDIIKTNADIVFKGIVQCSKQALDAGIAVGLGTDSACPYVTHYDMWREVIYFNELVGVSAKFALHTATLRNAEILGIDDITGSIEEGKVADMIVTNENPLHNLETLRYLDKVIRNGKIIDTLNFPHLEQIDAELDEVLHIQD